MRSRRGSRSDSAEAPKTESTFDSASLGGGSPSLADDGPICSISCHVDDLSEIGAEWNEVAGIMGTLNVILGIPDSSFKVLAVTAVCN